MGRDNDLVKWLCIRPPRLYEHAVSRPFDGLNWRPQAQTVAPRRDKRLDVASRPAANRAPVRATLDAEHPVVVEELSEKTSREAPHLARIGRPHGRRLRNDQPLDEGVREAAILEPLAERRPLAGGE